MKKLRPSSVRTTPGCTEVRQIHQTRPIRQIHQTRPDQIKKNPQRRPSNNLFQTKKDLQKGLFNSKETLEKRHIQIKRDIQKRPIQIKRDLQKRPLLAIWTHLSYPSMSTQQRFPATARVGGKARAKTECWRVYSAHTLSRGRSPSVCVFVCVRVCVCV